MRTLCSPFVALFAALAVATAMLGQGYAQARPDRGPVTAIVICAEAGLATILVDSRGNPVDPADCATGLCADCILAPPLAVAPEDLRPGPRRFARHKVPPCKRVGARARRHPARPPRGPPSGCEG